MGRPKGSKNINRIGEYKKCSFCGMEKYFQPNQIRRKNRKGFFCSRICLGKFTNPKGNRVYKMTDEIRRRISLAHVGIKRLPHTEESKRKIGMSNKGKTLGRPNLKLRKINHKSDESKLWRVRIEYRLWRESVFARDNWTCQKCKIRGSMKLHPHHIYNFYMFKDLRFAIDNGITLCEKCHKEFHKIYSNRNNNENQLNQFINNLPKQLENYEIF